MRILVLTQKLPFPAADGYNLRVLEYVPRLAERHELRFVGLDVGEWPPGFERHFQEVERVPRRVPPKAPRWQLPFRLFSPAELHDSDPAVGDVVRRQVEAFRPDVIWCVGWNLLRNALDQDAPVLADVIDEGAREAWLDFKADPTFRRFLWLVRTLRFERRYFRAAERCLFVSEQDVRITERVAPGVRAVLVQNGVDADHYAPNGEPIEPETLVFEGTMSHIPNVEGMRFFCKEVLPRLRAERPGVKLKIVGRDPLPRVTELAQPSTAETGVEVTGFVDDVRPHVRGAAAFVCPLIGGAGLKNKVLQAWAMGKAVVATPISLGGLDVRDGENVLVARDADELLAACRRVLDDPALAARLGAAGRETVLERYTWDRATADLEQQLAEVAGHRQEYGARHLPPD